MAKNINQFFHLSFSAKPVLTAWPSLSQSRRQRLN